MTFELALLTLDYCHQRINWRRVGVCLVIKILEKIQIITSSGEMACRLHVHSEKSSSIICKLEKLHQTSKEMQIYLGRINTNDRSCDHQIHRIRTTRNADWNGPTRRTPDEGTSTKQGRRIKCSVIHHRPSTTRPGSFFMDSSLITPLVI